MLLIKNIERCSSLDEESRVGGLTEPSGLVKGGARVEPRGGKIGPGDHV